MRAPPILAATLLLVLVGCNRDLRGLQCDAELQCAPGFVCNSFTFICEPAEGCADDVDCGPDARCDNGACVSSEFDCAVCTDEQRECVPDGFTCGECLPGLEDVGGDCVPPGCLASGEPCVDGGPPCCQGSCFALADGSGGQCLEAGACLNEGLACDGLAEPCCNGFSCDPVDGCVPGACFPDGANCIDDIECCEGSCVANTCSADVCLVDETGPCDDDTQLCCPEVLCTGVGVCQPTCQGAGGSCTGNADCCFGHHCEAGTCVFDDQSGRTCTVTADCSAGLECLDNGFGFLACTFVSACGDDITDPGTGEECDPPGALSPCNDRELGAGDMTCDNGCTLDTSACELPHFCGNGLAEFPEACDGDSTPCDNVTGAVSSGAFCNSTCNGFVLDDCCASGEFVRTADTSCQPVDPGCGDGFTDGVEGCDDGNNQSGDGCSANCQLEDNAVCNTTVAPALCFTRHVSCGDTLVQGGFGEECEPPGPGGCNDLCRVETCGDGLVQGGEACDDGNLNDGDGCASDCDLEACSNHYATCATDGDCCPGLSCSVQAATPRCRFP